MDLAKNEAEENCLHFDCFRNPPVLTIAEMAVATERGSIRHTTIAPSFNVAITSSTRILISMNLVAPLLLLLISF